MQAQSLLDTATVISHPTHKTPPSLGPGKLTPAVLQEWHDAASHYFTKHKTEPTEQVATVLPSFLHPSIKNWVALNRDTLLEPNYTFASLIQDLRTNFLDPLWVHHLIRTVIYARMTETETFEDYANGVMAANNLLRGTLNHLTKPQLRDTLETHISEYLYSKIHSLPTSEQEHMVQLENFDEWIVFMKRTDDIARAELRRFRSSPQKPSSSFVPYPRMQRALRDTDVPNRPPLVTGANAITSPPRRLPRLTDIERDTLEVHHGCKKCRRFYVKHTFRNCPNDFPDVTTYQPLTFEMAQDAYHAST